VQQAARQLMKRIDVYAIIEEARKNQLFKDCTEIDIIITTKKLTVTTTIKKYKVAGDDFKVTTYQFKESRGMSLYVQSMFDVENLLDFLNAHKKNSTITIAFWNIQKGVAAAEVTVNKLGEMVIA